MYTFFLFTTTVGKLNSYVLNTTLTGLLFSSCSFTLIHVIHTLSLSCLLAKFHTTCPRQSRFTDYYPLDAKCITRMHVDGKLHSDTCTHDPRHAVPYLSVWVYSSYKVFPWFGSPSGHCLGFLDGVGQTDGELHVLICSLLNFCLVNDSDSQSILDKKVGIRWYLAK